MITVFGKRIPNVPRHADDILLLIMVRLRWELMRPKNDKRGPGP